MTPSIIQWATTHDFITIGKNVNKQLAINGGEMDAS